MLTDAIRKKGRKINKDKLTLRQKTAIAEYVKTGNKSAAIRAAYNYNKKQAPIVANRFFKQPKIVSALNKALKDHNFDDSFAVDHLKKIVQAGMENLDITRPDTSLKGLELFWKITNKLGGNKEPLKVDPESAARKMDLTQLQQVIKDLDKKQKRILAIIQGKPEEGEVL